MSTKFTKEMQQALEVDGKKLQQLTGDNHGPEFLDELDELIAELREHERDYPSLIHGPLCGRAADVIESQMAEHARGENLREALDCVDDQDWDFLLSKLGDGGRERFWKTVIAKLRSSLSDGGQG